MSEVVFKKFAGVYCYIPFSSTFSGFDTFTYTVYDNDGLESAPATMSIEIFED